MSRTRFDPRCEGLDVDEEYCGECGRVTDRHRPQCSQHPVNLAHVAALDEDADRDDAWEAPN